MKRVKQSVLALAAVVSLALISASAAVAAPVHIDITEAVLDLGTLKKVPAIGSELGDPPATFDGELVGNDLTIPKDGFYFPPKDAEVSAGINATIKMFANQDIVGTYDATSGALEIAVDLKATVEVFGSECVISPLSLSLSTSNGKPYLGVPFVGGLDKPGAVSARWTGLPPVAGDGMCGTVGQLIAGPGGIWMAQDIKVAQTCANQPAHPGCDVASLAPEAAPNVTDGPDLTTDSPDATFKFQKGAAETANVTGFQCAIDGGAFAACDSGTQTYTGLSVADHTFSVKATNSIGEGPVTDYTWTITKKVTPPPPGEAKLGGLKIKPKTKTVKRGKKAVVKVTVKNVGDAAATGARVCVKAPKKLVKVKRCVNLGAVAAGKAKTAKFKVTVSKKAKKGKKAVLKFKATANKTAARSGKATIRVK